MDAYAERALAVTLGGQWPGPSGDIESYLMWLCWRRGVLEGALRKIYRSSEPKGDYPTVQNVRAPGVEDTPYCLRRLCRDVWSYGCSG